MFRKDFSKKISTFFRGYPIYVPSKVGASSTAYEPIFSTVRSHLGLGNFPRPREIAVFNPREIP